jgi:hypothetical protein
MALTCCFCGEHLPARKHHHLATPVQLAEAAHWRRTQGWAPLKTSQHLCSTHRRRPPSPLLSPKVRHELPRDLQGKTRLGGKKPGKSPSVAATNLAPRVRNSESTGGWPYCHWCTCHDNHGEEGRCFMRMFEATAKKERLTEATAGSYRRNGMTTTYVAAQTMSATAS